MKRLCARRAAALLLAAVCLAACLAGCRRRSEGERPIPPGLQTLSGEPIHEDGVALRSDHFTVSAGMMAYYFYDIGGGILAELEKETPFDDSRSLHDQMVSDSLSFYDAILDEVVAEVCEMLIWCESALEAGGGLTAEQEEAVEAALVNWRVNAATFHLSLDEYLQGMYGPLMREDDLCEVLRIQTLSASRAEALRDELEGGITEEAIREYAAAHDLTDGTRSRSIAFLLLVDSDREKTAEEALAALKKSPKAATLDAYADAGQVRTEENLTPANTGIAEIADWLFAKGRRVGDCGVVESGSLCYVLLYTGEGMTYGEVSARMSLYDEAYAAWYNGWVERLHFGYNVDVLDGYDVDR